MKKTKMMKMIKSKNKYKKSSILSNLIDADLEQVTGIEPAY